jgi:hypothetical protein
VCPLLTPSPPPYARLLASLLRAAKGAADRPRPFVRARVLAVFSSANATSPALPVLVFRPDLSVDETRVAACGFDKTFKMLETDRGLLEALRSEE